MTNLLGVINMTNHVISLDGGGSLGPREIKVIDVDLPSNAINLAEGRLALTNASPGEFNPGGVTPGNISPTTRYVTVPVGDESVPVNLAPYIGTFLEYRVIADVIGAFGGDVITLTVKDYLTGLTKATTTDAIGYGKVAPDTSASNRTVTAVGGVTVDADGSGYVLDGTTGYLMMSHINIGQFGAYTMECRFKRASSTALASEQQLMGQWSDTGGNVTAAIWLDHSFGIMAAITDTSNAGHFISNSSLAWDTSEHHVESNWNGATLRLFVDGVMVSSTSSASCRDVAAIPFMVGAKATFNEKFAGTIDNIALHKVCRHNADTTFTPLAEPINDSNTLFLLPASSLSFDDPVGHLNTGWKPVSPYTTQLLIDIDNPAARGVVDNLRVELRA
jgi:hypothetical protein